MLITEIKHLIILIKTDFGIIIKERLTHIVNSIILIENLVLIRFLKDY